MVVTKELESGEEMVKYPLTLPKPLHRKLKLLSVIEDRSIREILVSLVAEYTKSKKGSITLE